MSDPITIPYWVFLLMCAFVGFGVENVLSAIQKYRKIKSYHRSKP